MRRWQTRPEPAPTARAPEAVTRLVLLEAASFGAAASVHAGLVGDGGTHPQAATAEVVIALVLVAALAPRRAPNTWRLRCAAGAQLFALVGVCVGLVAIANGVGPQSEVDLAYHLAIVPFLVVGAATTWRLAASGQQAEGGSP